MPLPVTIDHNNVRIGENFSFRFHRTLRVPDDEKTRGLPASLGTFDVCRVDDYADRVPREWLEHGGVFICMWPHEAMWISFCGEYTHPVAVKLATGKVCAITGKTWRTGLCGGDEQDYMLVPGQPWVDGFKCRDGRVRQFVGALLGNGETVEAQVTGKEDVGGFQMQIFECKEEHRRAPVKFAGAHGMIPKGAGGSGLGGALGGNVRYMARMAAPQVLCSTTPMPAFSASPDQVKGAEMGLAAGGLIEQAILKAHEWQPDRFDLTRTGRVFIHIVDANMFAAITGKAAHPSPITPETYKQNGYPWFSTWGTDAGNDVAVKTPLAKIKSVGQIGKEKKEAWKTGLIDADDETIIHLGGKVVKDGNW